MSTKKPEKQLSLLPVSGVKRATVSLPSDLLYTLDALSSSAGISRSAFLSALLARVLPSLEMAVVHRASVAKDALKCGIDHDVVMKRYSESSKAAIDELINSLTVGNLHDILNRD